MNLKQAKQQFRQQFVFDKTDKPAAGQAWCIFIDCLHRDGSITDSQVQSWPNPYNN
jgi:hypothetical protein